MSLALIIAPQLYPLFLKQNIPLPLNVPANLFTTPSVSATSVAEPQPTQSPAPFNPNTANKETLVQAGLPERTANTLLHYRQAGGRFHQKTDLKKIYGLKEEDYNRIEPYIQFETDAESNVPANSVAENRKSPIKSPSFSSNREQRRKPTLSPFDPNSATEEQLLDLGLMLKSVKVLENYRNKGGQFHKKEDLKKIYGLPDSDYTRLEPFIQISESQQIKQSFNQQQAPSPNHLTKETRQDYTVDINIAKEDDLLRLRGIGRTFAAAILNQREKLGGFASFEQLKEIYGLPDSTLQHIKTQLKFSTPIYRIIKLNKADLNGLTHPYLSRKQAEVLLRYRINHGDFKNSDDLKNTNILTTENIEKLKPYIAF